MTFNEYFATDFCTYNDNGIDAFIAMLEFKGFELTRNDWFQCGSNSSIKYTYRTDNKYINFAYKNGNRIEVGNYNLE
jgi:hypothetical protein